VVALVVFMHGAAIRFWNYAVYSAASSAGVLILLDLLQPSSYGAEGDRVLWTLCGLGIGLIVLFLAGLPSVHPPRNSQYPLAMPDDDRGGVPLAV
jgi:uncharacterized membrane protein YccC